MLGDCNRSDGAKHGDAGGVVGALAPEPIDQHPIGAGVGAAVEGARELERSGAGAGR